MPVDLVVDVDLVAFKADRLDELRVLKVPGDEDRVVVRLSSPRIGLIDLTG